nr:hypothetical protein [Tanacetum cinerariifolium]
MIAILEKYEHNQDFHQIVDFVEASHIRYTLTFNPIVYVSHIRRFWSTARIETTKEGTKILATVDGNIQEELIAQSLALPPVADEPASLIRDDSQGEACPTDSGLEADQDRANITKTSTLPSDLTPRVTSLAADEGRDELDEGDEAAEKGSDDTAKMVTVLTSLDATTILSSGVVEVPTGSGSILTTGPPATGVPTGSEVVPTASPIFTTVIESTPYTRRKGKEKMVESDIPKKNKLQEQIDVQVMMIDGLDRNNETVAKYLQEYHQFATELPIERRIELISDLVKYQDNYAKVLKYQTQQRKPLTKKQQREFYTLDFIPIGSKEESERLKRKGIRFEQDSAKKLKTSEEVPEEKLKEMMELIPIEEVYVEALQVKHPIIDWEVHTEGERSYWKITRLGGSSVSYQFFVDLLKHFDKEDLNQLWALVKESLSIRPATSDKEMELKRLSRNFHACGERLPSEEGSCVSNDMLQASGIPTGSDDYPLPEQLPTANEDKFPLLIQSDATAEELCAAAEVKK